MMINLSHGRTTYNDASLIYFRTPKSKIVASILCSQYTVKDIQALGAFTVINVYYFKRFAPLPLDGF